VQLTSFVIGGIFGCLGFEYFHYFGLFLPAVTLSCSGAFYTVSRSRMLFFEKLELERKERKKVNKKLMCMFNDSFFFLFIFFLINLLFFLFFEKLELERKERKKVNKNLMFMFNDSYFWAILFLLCSYYLVDMMLIEKEQEEQAREEKIKQQEEFEQFQKEQHQNDKIALSEGGETRKVFYTSSSSRLLGISNRPVSYGSTFSTDEFSSPFGSNDYYFGGGGGGGSGHENKDKDIELTQF
jgi:hypothetical protein